MEALYIVVLCILGGTRNLLFTSACVVDDDCPYGQRCCISNTPSGNVVKKGVCITWYNWEKCDKICRTQDDCVLPQRCDTSGSYVFCTTECYKDEHCYHISHEYVCNYNEEIDQNECMPVDKGIDLSSDSAILYILTGCVVTFFCICCTCLKCHQRRNQGAGRRRMVTSNTRPTGTNVQPNRSAQRPETLQMNSTQAPPEESSGPNLDAIALSGPPSYVEVGDVPESPPPTYEEATKKM